MRSIDLAIYADALAGEASSVAARLERARSRTRLAGIEAEARAELPRPTVARLDELGLLATRADHAELRELRDALAALEELQAWVEERLRRAA